MTDHTASLTAAIKVALTTWMRGTLSGTLSDDAIADTMNGVMARSVTSIVDDVMGDLHDKVYESIIDKYQPKMERLLVDIGTAAEDAGWRFDGGVVDSSDEDAEVSIVLRQHRPPEDDEDEPVHDADVDIRFSIAKQSNHDRAGNGIAFRVDASTVDGRVIGDMTPYNYSDDVWVDMFDADAVASRFAAFEDTDVAGEVVAVCAEYLVKA